jgi:hypothetical protein
LFHAPEAAGRDLLLAVLTRTQAIRARLQSMHNQARLAGQQLFAHRVTLAMRQARTLSEQLAGRLVR